MPAFAFDSVAFDFGAFDAEPPGYGSLAPVVGRDVSDHVAVAISRLPEQFKSSSIMIALLSALVRPLQELDAAAYVTMLTRALSVALGVQLDLLGGLVGQARNAQSDITYRRYISARIVTNRSSSVAADHRHIAKILLDGIGTVEVRQSGTATVIVRVHDGAVSAALADTLLFFLTAATSGGVRLILVTAPQSTAETFTTSACFRLGAAVLAGATELTPIAPNAIRLFPSGGFVRLNFGGAGEVVAYHKSADRTKLLLDGSTAAGYAQFTRTQLTDSSGADATVGKGFGTTTDASVGGAFVSARSML